MMLSIGRFAQLAKVSARTVRYYESIGLLPKSIRGENNYRYYDPQWLDRMNRIRDLQGLGFSLEDIKTITSFSDSDLQTRLQKRLSEIAHEVSNLEARRERIKNLLSVSSKIETGDVSLKRKGIFICKISGKKSLKVWKNVIIKSLTLL